MDPHVYMYTCFNCLISTLQLGSPLTHQQEVSLEREHYMYFLHLHVLYIVSYEATATKYIIIGLAQLWYFFNYFKNQFKVAEHSFGSL